MAALIRALPDSVIHRLYTRPQEFEFAQAIRLLEFLQPQALPLGCGVNPCHEAVRLHGLLTPIFPQSELSTLENSDTRPLLTTALFGLGGPDGPLPYAYQEWLQQQHRDKNYAPAAFLQLFQHRLLSLLYRAQRKFRLASNFTLSKESPAHQTLCSLVGLLPVGIQQRQLVPDEAFLARAALFANQRRSLAGFVVLVRHYFSVPVQATPFVGKWRDIPSALRTTLGCFGKKGRNDKLGQGALIGYRAWDEHAGIRLTLGPLSYASYQNFLPGATQHRALASLAIFYFGFDMDCALTLLLHKDNTMPVLTLQHTAPPRLGWQSQLGTNQLPQQLDTFLEKTWERAA